MQDDVGSPIWQYVMGRAVIIGIVSHMVFVRRYQPCNYIGWPTLAVRVSSYIDWIMSVTGLDIWHLNQTGHTAQYRDDNGELNKGLQMNVTLRD